MAFLMLYLGTVALALGAPVPQSGKPSAYLEGYRLVDLQVSGATAFPREALMAEFPIRVGDKADMSRVTEGLNRIKRLFEEAGYIDFKYTPWMDVDRAAKTVACSFDIVQGRQYTIRLINLTGINPLADGDIRSAIKDLGLEEDKIFRPSLINEAVKRINKILGAEAVASKSFEIMKASDQPGKLDIFLKLPR
jgi:hypothetical protein